MGGWRCTYRNCTGASDGKTHLFHYPVFDKVRCLKWLTNACKLEFLDLKVSQLKNRVVCEHHFKDEFFMNYKKEKLTFEAVPTEDGIFCDRTHTYNEKYICPITFDDIENSEVHELTPNEKKANLSIKYAEFLTDPVIHSADNIVDPLNAKRYNYKDFLDKTNMPEIDSNKKLHENEISNDDYIHYKIWSHRAQESKDVQQNTQFSASLPLCSTDNLIDKGISFHVEVHVPPTPEIVSILEATPHFVNNSNSNKLLSDDILLGSEINPNNNTDVILNNFNNTASPEKNSRRNNKIKILSEKTLTVPLPVVGSFKPVCPTGILNPPKRKIETESKNKENSYILTDVKLEPQAPEHKAIEHPVRHIMSPPKLESVLTVPSEAQMDLKIISSPIKTQRRNIASNSRSPSTTNLKNKIPPERVAAIEEKRTFNKKLRDMIEFCLDDKEENIKIPVAVKSTSKTPLTSKSDDYKSQVTSLLNTPPLYKKCIMSASDLEKKGLDDEPELESTVNDNKVIRGSENNVILPDSKLSILEAKLSRMENLLLRKVGENTQRIDNLKQTLTKSNDVNKKRSIQTQTIQDKDTHKKELFQEISRYLSPDLNSLIYEELFMKKFEQPYTNVRTRKVENTSPIKRQRRR